MSGFPGRRFCPQLVQRCSHLCRRSSPGNCGLPPTLRRLVERRPRAVPSVHRGRQRCIDLHRLIAIGEVASWQRTHPLAAVSGPGWSFRAGSSSGRGDLAIGPTVDGRPARCPNTPARLRSRLGARDAGPLVPGLRVWPEPAVLDRSNDPVAEVVLAIELPSPIWGT